jgi:hypothetical protein
MPTSPLRSTSISAIGRCQISTEHVALTLDIIGIFLTKPVALDESAHVSTIASSSGSVMKAIANKSDFAVSSLEVAILRMSMGFEFRLDIWYK